MNLLTAMATAAETETAAELFFQPGNFVNMLQYMGIGMLVIFVIVGVIILSTVVINRLFSNK